MELLLIAVGIFVSGIEELCSKQGRSQLRAQVGQKMAVSFPRGVWSGMKEQNPKELLLKNQRHAGGHRVAFLPKLDATPFQTNGVVDIRRCGQCQQETEGG